MHKYTPFYMCSEGHEFPADSIVFRQFDNSLYRPEWCVLCMDQGLRRGMQILWESNIYWRGTKSLGYG